MSGTGRLTTIKSFVERLAAADGKPEDICFVYNFRSPDEPCGLILGAGAGSRLRDGMDGLIEELSENLPAILRVNPDGSTTNVANLNAWLAKNPPAFIKDTNPDTTDLEPGGGEGGSGVGARAGPVQTYVGLAVGLAEIELRIYITERRLQRAEMMQAPAVRSR